MGRFPAAAILFLSATVGADTLVMKSGEKYQTNGPSTHKNGRVTFTTTANRVYSVKESEVSQEISGPPPASLQQIDRTDSRQLGAIAREQREKRGETAPVEGKTGDRPKPGDSGKRQKRKKKSAPKQAAPPPPSDENR